MAVNKYRVSLLELEDCPLQLTPRQFLRVLRTWRRKRAIGHVCSECKKRIEFAPGASFGLCCDAFYHDDRIESFPTASIAVPTPGYKFALPQLERMIGRSDVETNQEFLIVPDPIFWHVQTTLVYEKAAKYVMSLPVTRRTENVLPPSKAPAFYAQIQEAPLNYGSLDSRSCGKATLMRQVAFAKRCSLSMRGMIVPDATLRPNEIRLPDFIVKKFGLKGKWVLLNRMPSLQPENFVALRVPPREEGWTARCFGVPLEILSSINGDFDGDEANVYLVFSHFSQAECAALLNPEWEMSSFVMGMKLHPSQDMLVAYYLFYDRIDFLPYKNPDLKKTFRVIADVFGSRAAFGAFEDMRKFYLDALENEVCFALDLAEMNWIADAIARGVDLRTGRGCLVTQILAGAKGSFEHLHQMFGRIGAQGDVDVKNSFWSGLTPAEAMAHAKVSHGALSQSSKIWQPGYGHNKIAFNLQGITVDYLGRLIDGRRRVVEKDALDAVHHTDAMSEETFDYLLDEVLVRRNFELAKM